ncbi:microcystin-dependent protein [Caulobacter ginsengisoli]|uniref:Microcystin-dependent protein n=1 Tax=Caulobacter ginsengisoli TaxID=400775 RepID=A0ABU0IYJ1_9CAUL|nr:tail fiber protein [Caulobacter ginsengisoli]MDQ0466124.1 microcystin-dependent protein [Caulobacter ginsengisoli]
MSTPFVAEIRIFSGNFAPRGWMACDGQILPIEQYRALFSLVGAAYGGDGETTFGIPDLRNSVPIGHGQGQGLRSRSLGDKSGANAVALKEAQLPRHGHAFNVSNNAADINGAGARPDNQYLAKGGYDDGSNSGVVAYYSTAAADVAMSPSAAAVAGASAPHNNMMPSLGVNFIIALQGIYPPRE